MKMQKICIWKIFNVYVTGRIENFHGIYAQNTKKAYNFFRKDYCKTSGLSNTYTLSLTNYCKFKDQSGSYFGFCRILLRTGRKSDIFIIEKPHLQGVCLILLKTRTFNHAIFSILFKWEFWICSSKFWTIARIWSNKKYSK